MTRNTLVAAALATTFALPAFAGGISDPIMDPEIIIQHVETPSSGSAMLPVIIFALLVAAATAG
ncbi:hypothetical protein SAMN05444287_1399 [Octadecabacter temperatus]|jgi:hypothetical protein|uniref:Uncharacterized protein n=1 Tax=Octadecabacter temperatus TaxID=1458307 RepID=A0A0K0Y628_9RHOB|nr:hypothetical protein [Octadecabacter temperatus]AKS46287.1 hypothetical protein OSB_17420 [Octadecabacter temperatus]SIO11287.1 hypothetical protein SAMN05444287_1399 [Octadecabacter temperatus]